MTDITSREYKMFFLIGIFCLWTHSPNIIVILCITKFTCIIMITMIHTLHYYYIFKILMLHYIFIRGWMFLLKHLLTNFVEKHIHNLQTQFFVASFIFYISGFQSFFPCAPFAYTFHICCIPLPLIPSHKNVCFY